MSKIKLGDIIEVIIIKMSNGNPGCLHAIVELIKKHDKIDPQAFMGAIGVLLTLDDMGLYGTEIYILYGDQCKFNIRRFIMLLRAIQLGYINKNKIIEIAKDQMDEVRLTEQEMDDLDFKVCSRLNQFQKQEKSK